MIEPDRCDGITYAIISNHLATYKELKDTYSADEFLDLYEMAVIRMANKINATAYNEKEKKVKNGR